MPDSSPTTAFGPSSASPCAINDNGALRVVLLNLMPNQKRTDAQFRKLLSLTGRKVEMTSVSLDQDPYSGTREPDLQLIAENYRAAEGHRSFADVQHQKFDLTIISGGDLEQHWFDGHEKSQAILAQVTRFIDWASKNADSSVLGCWTAHVGLKHIYGVERDYDPRKRLGIPEHQIFAHPLTQGLKTLSMAAGRNANIWADDLIGTGVTTLAVNEKFGVGLAASRDGSMIFLPGTHPEYMPISDSDRSTRDDLQAEFERDVKRNADNPQTYPTVPYTPEFSDADTISDAALLFGNIIHLIDARKHGVDPNNQPFAHHAVAGTGPHMSEQPHLAVTG